MFNQYTWKRTDIIQQEKPVNDETNSGGARPLPSISTQEAIK